MSTFADFIVKAQARVDNQNDRTAPYLREATIRWLGELSVERTLMMEATFSFTTTIDQADYSPGYSGFPVDAMEFHAVYAQIGSGASAQNYPIQGPLSIEEVRVTFWEPNATHPRPYVWAWHHDTMIVAPTPSTAITIKGDYFRDGKRDTATGALITTASTTHTNPWFDRGEQALLNAVLWDYYLAIPKDMEAAAACEILYQRALKTLKAERTQKAYKGGQAAPYFGAGLGAGSLRP